MPFIVSGPGVPKGRIDHSLISAVDYFPTISALSGIPIPEGTVLRGGNIAGKMVILSRFVALSVSLTPKVSLFQTSGTAKSTI